MKKQTRSILDELNNLGLSKDQYRLIETTANNIINSSINLINNMHKNYDTATANELERRFLNSIKSGDPRKFKRGVQKVIESRKKNDS